MQIFQKSLLGLLLLSLLSPGDAEAQRYYTGAGIRLSTDHLGISLQQRLLRQTTLEFMGTVNTNDARFGGFVQQHGKILGRRLNYYVGAGGHIGGLNNYGFYKGIDFILGIEYSPLLLPIILSFDFQPALHYGHSEKFEMRSALTVRKVLIKDNQKKKRQRQRQKKKRQKEKSKK